MTSVSAQGASTGQAYTVIRRCDDGWSGRDCDVPGFPKAPPRWGGPQGDVPPPFFLSQQTLDRLARQPEPAVSLWSDVVVPVATEAYPPTAMASSGQEFERLWKERDINGSMLGFAMVAGPVVLSKKARALGAVGEKAGKWAGKLFGKGDEVVDAATSNTTPTPAGGFLNWVWGTEKPLQAEMAHNKKLLASKTETIKEPATASNDARLMGVRPFTVEINYPSSAIQYIADDVESKYKDEIKARIETLEKGNLGDWKPVVGSVKGIVELRMHNPGGPRIYITRTGETRYKVVGISDKDRQDKVIRLLREFYKK